MMSRSAHLLLIFLFSIAFLAVPQWVVASNCPEPFPLLQSGIEDRLIADVTVVAIVPSPVEGQPDGAVVDVSKIYAGYAPNRILIESYREQFLGGGCGYYLERFDIGTRLIVAVTQNPQTGRYGGVWRENFAPVIDDRVQGFVEGVECSIGEEQSCYPRASSVSLEAFETAIEVIHPDSYSEKQRLDSGFTVISLGDGLPTVGSEVSLNFETRFCDFWTPNAVRINDEQRVIDFSFYQFENGDNDFMTFSPCFREVGTFPVGRVYREGDYELRIYEETSRPENDFFQPQNLIGQMTIDVGQPATQAVPETPLAGSIQSGIGLIRGWACDATSVMVQFDNLPPLEMAYGTLRMDTVSVCGDSNNGYGGVFAWGSLGEGLHRMRTTIDGKEVGDIEFEVRGLGNAYVEGLSGEYQLDGFPGNDEAVVVRWSQAAQNFVIVDKLDLQQGM